MERIYMDHHATTPTLPEVVEEMLPYFSEKFGNPASATHQFGETAAAAVDRARSLVAGLIGANRQEIVFTSGATESNNLALRGVTRIRRGAGGHIVTSVIEHQAILETLDQLEQDGFRVTRLGVDRFGRVDPEKVREAIAADTILVSIQFANGEIGTVQPIAEIGRIT
ncbi:MAG: aminotransferase class V-fold PLP-dependent enzyme, partial [Acidobacteriota bacterium]